MILKQGGALDRDRARARRRGALALGRVLASQIEKVGAFDPGVLALAVVGLGGAALVATWLPARRAARIDPIARCARNSAIDYRRSDVAFAFRQFARQPRFFAVVALTLIVGIAASTSIFAVVDGVLLRPLPYPESTRLVRLDTNSFRGEYYHLRQQATTLDVAAYYPAPMEVTVNLGDEPCCYRAPE